MKIIYENEIQKLVVRSDFYIVIFFMWLIIFNLWTEMTQKRKMYRKNKIAHYHLRSHLSHPTHMFWRDIVSHASDHAGLELYRPPTHSDLPASAS